MSSLQLHCPNYHSRDDKRRPPFVNGQTALTYSQNYIEDFYSTQMSSNLVEYLFHPNLYKTIPCRYRLNAYYCADGEVWQECKVKYCPYLHKDEDVSGLEKYRNLPLLVQNEEEYIEKIEQAEEVQMLLKGDKNEIKAKYG